MSTLLDYQYILPHRLVFQSRGFCRGSLICLNYLLSRGSKWLPTYKSVFSFVSVIAFANLVAHNFPLTLFVISLIHCMCC